MTSAYPAGARCPKRRSIRHFSKDLRSWEIVDTQFDYLSQVSGATEEDYELRFGAKQKPGLEGYYMDSEVDYLADTFHIFTSLYGTKTSGCEVAGGPMWLRSTTGRAEGPYEYADHARSQSSVLVDNDGATYLFYNGKLLPFDPQGNSLSGEAMRLETTASTRCTKGDVATNLAKIHSKYIVFGTGWCGANYGENYRVNGTYDWVYWQSDTLDGPSQMPRRAYAMPHCGHSCQLQQGPDGRWFGLFFDNESTGPCSCYLGPLVFDVRLDADDTGRIEIKEELP